MLTLSASGLMRRWMLLLATGCLLLSLVSSPVSSQAPVPALREPVDEIAGALVLVGRGNPPDAVGDRFVQLAGEKKARLVVLSTADDPHGENRLEVWKKRGVTSVVRLHARQRDEADQQEFVKPLTEATGVWLEADDPAQLTAAYRNTMVETALRKLLSRGGVLGGTTAGAAAMSPLLVSDEKKTTGVGGFGFLPGGLVDPQAGKDQRPDRLVNALARHAGYFGLGIDERTALVIQGRRLSVLGEGVVTLCQSAGANRPASTKQLKAGQEADLVALSRDAIVRTQEPFPPRKPLPPHVAKGALVIGGGGGLAPDIWKRFIDLAGGPESLLVVVPTANPDPLPKEAGELKALVKAGAKNVKVLHTRSRGVANQPAFAAVVKEAKGVWFSGGRQWRFVDAYEGTASEKAFHEVLARGGVIGGSSAGASIQSEYMPRGDPLGNLNIIAPGYERGFGFLKGVAVDQHFFVRKREKDMTELIKTYPQLLGIGIDEGTAIVVQQSILEVVGKSKVAVYDRSRPVPDSGKDYEELPAGAKYDLEKRQRVEPK